MADEGEPYLVLAPHKADAADFIYLAGFAVQEGIGKQLRVYKPYLFAVALVVVGGFEALVAYC